MTMHPSLSEMRSHFLRDSRDATLVAHLATCIACRVRYARIVQMEEPSSPRAETIQRIVEASGVVPGLGAVASAQGGMPPHAGDLWRVGREEALLAWVRQNFGDGSVDVVPVVLDVDLAEEESVLVSAAASPLSVELALMVALRTHVHEGAFIDRVGSVDAASEVEEVISAAREGRPSLALVGPRLEAEDDERLEYRQAVRDLFAELSPSAWATDEIIDGNPAAELEETPTQINIAEGSLAWFGSMVSDRLPSAKCFALDEIEFPVDADTRISTFAKVAYLDTAVIVATVESAGALTTRVADLARACTLAVSSSPDADAICIVARVDDWPSMLFSQASLRDALELPGGAICGPAVLLSGLNVWDTLWKHLEGAAPAWDVAEAAPRGLVSVDVASIASHHAEHSIDTVRGQGRRAQQPAKKAAWANLSERLADRVARLVASAADGRSASEALAEFERESSDDSSTHAE